MTASDRRHCDRCNRPLPHSTAELVVCLSQALGEGVARSSVSVIDRAETPMADRLLTDDGR